MFRTGPGPRVPATALTSAQPRLVAGESRFAFPKSIPAVCWSWPQKLGCLRVDQLLSVVPGDARLPRVTG